MEGLLGEENPQNRKCWYHWCTLLCRESVRGNTSGCFHMLKWKNKLIYFPRPIKSSSIYC